MPHIIHDDLLRVQVMKMIIHSLLEMHILMSRASKAQINSLRAHNAQIDCLRVITSRLLLEIGTN